MREDRRYDLYRLADDRYDAVVDGRSVVLGVTILTADPIDGPRLRILWDGGSTDV